MYLVQMILYSTVCLVLWCIFFVHYDREIPVFLTSHNSSCCHVVFYISDGESSFHRLFYQVWYSTSVFSNNNINIAQDRLLYSRLLLYVCAEMYSAKQWNHLNLCWFLVIREEAKETFLQQHLSNTVRWLEERKTRHEVRLPNITLLVTYMYIEWCSVRESMFVQENHEVSSAIVSTLHNKCSFANLVLSCFDHIWHLWNMQVVTFEVWKHNWYKAIHLLRASVACIVGSLRRVFVKTIVSLQVVFPLQNLLPLPSLSSLFRFVSLSSAKIQYGSQTDV